MTKFPAMSSFDRSTDTAKEVMPVESRVNAAEGIVAVPVAEEKRQAKVIDGAAWPKATTMSPEAVPVLVQLNTKS